MCRCRWPCERTASPRPYPAAQTEGNRSSALGCPPPDRDTSSVPSPGCRFRPPARSRCSFANAGGFAFQAPLRSLDPSEDRRVVDLDAAIEQHELQITVADGKHQIPSHGPKDHLGCELAPLEAITQTHSDARPIVPHSIIPELRQQRSLQQNLSAPPTATRTAGAQRSTSPT